MLRAPGEGYLLPKALLELGSALVHFARGYADEGSVYLRQATDLARERGYGYIASTGLRELGFLESKVGRRPAAAEYLSQALDLAEDSETLYPVIRDELAGSHGRRGNRNWLRPSCRTLTCQWLDSESADTIDPEGSVFNITLTIRATAILTALMSAFPADAQQASPQPTGTDRSKIVELLRLSLECPRPIVTVSEKGIRVRRVIKRGYDGDASMFKAWTWVREVSLGDGNAVLADRLIERRANVSDLSHAAASGARLTIHCKRERCFSVFVLTSDDAQALRACGPDCVKAPHSTEPQVASVASLDLCDAHSAVEAADSLNMLIQIGGVAAQSLPRGR